MKKIYFLFLLFFIILIRPNSSLICPYHTFQDFKNYTPEDRIIDIFISELSDVPTDLLDESDIKGLLKFPLFAFLNYRPEPYYNSFSYIFSHSDLNWQDFTDLSPPII